MKIDKNSFPSLLKIIESKVFKTNFSKPPEYIDNVKMKLNEIVPACLNNIEYLTRPIIEACDFCAVDTVKKLLSLRIELQSTEKVFLYTGEGGGMPRTNETQFVKFDRQEGKTGFMIFGFTDIHKNPITLSYFTVGMFIHSDPWNVYNIADFSYVHPNNSMNTNEYKKFIQYKIDLAIQFEVFMQYAQTEIKNLKPYHKDMSGVLCRYENKSKLPINIIDSTWFTSLVKSDSFKVRGHFRLQPYGHGLKNRKLIWINDFVKEGYTREAKILSEHPTTAGTL